MHEPLRVPVCVSMCAPVCVPVCTCVSVGLLLQLCLTLSPRSLHLPGKLTARKLSMNLLRRQDRYILNFISSMNKHPAFDKSSG